MNPKNLEATEVYEGEKYYNNEVTINFPYCQRMFFVIELGISILACALIKDSRNIN